RDRNVTGVQTCALPILKDGRWAYTSEPIIFSENGNLLNGQHRLVAIIKTGIAAELLVTFKVEGEAFKYMDAGTKRGAMHIFEIEGIKNYTFQRSEERRVGKEER